MSRDLLGKARARGIVLYRDGDQVRARLQGDPDPDLIDELREHKQDILAALDEERNRTIADSVDRLFAERPEYRQRRVGQVACELYFGGWVSFPARDAEVGAVLAERPVVALAS